MSSNGNAEVADYNINHCNWQERIQQYIPTDPTGEDDSVVRITDPDLGEVGLAYIRTLSGPSVNERLRFVRSIDHPNFVKVKGIFRPRDEDFLSVTFELLPVTVVDLCAQAYCHMGPHELAAIMIQVCAPSSICKIHY